MQVSLGKDLISARPGGCECKINIIQAFQIFVPSWESVKKAYTFVIPSPSPSSIGCLYNKNTFYCTTFPFLHFFYLRARGFTIVDLDNLDIYPYMSLSLIS